MDRELYFLDPDGCRHGPFPSIAAAAARAVELNIPPARNRYQPGFAMTADELRRVVALHTSTPTVLNMEEVEEVEIAPAPPAPVAAPKPPRGGRITRAVAAETVSETAEERIKRHEAHAAKFGIALPPPVRPLGMTVNATGVENFAASHAEWSALPKSVDALASLADLVDAEKRADVPVTLADIRLRPDGRLYRLSQPDRAGLLLEEDALSGLFSHTLLREPFPRAGDFFKSLPAERRARYFNEVIAEWAIGNADRKAQIRTRVGKNGDRVIWGVVGPDYRPFDINKVARAAIDGIGQLALGTAPRGEALYDPGAGRLRADVMWHADHIVDLGAGDVFKGGARITTQDLGGGAIRITLVLVRNRCVNLIILGTGKNCILRITHLSDYTEAEVAAEIASALRNQVGALIEGFAADWGLLRSTPITRAGVTVYGETFADVPKALEWMVRTGKIDGIAANDVATEALLTNWKEEPGNTLADLVNAVTRYAHRGAEKVLVPVSRGEEIEGFVGDSLMPDLTRFARKAWA